ncbi:hypothetical protein C8R34_11553 [Nitrosomonas sp. Nm84]|nr:hypothetical protein C8R34_11553 [Nitrosomonas sp. Nm84]
MISVKLEKHEIDGVVYTSAESNIDRVFCLLLVR